MRNNEGKIRTRFAPSPTGVLHVGSARTALFCWLFARQQQGDMILRIEDTDRERSTEESVQAILEGMQWLGLDYDEGPYFQTQRMDRYKEVVQHLLDDGKAYRCYCSKERLEQLRAEQTAQKIKPRYDGHCRDLKPRNTNEPYVVRFRNPQDGVVTFYDMIRGEITVSNNELDDLIIARADGMPTYNFTVVVDDWDMKITDVIRGDDHINNTPRQINILQALGAELPRYAHVPMILGPDGQRLSKRHGAVSLQQYRDDGYLSDALLNYLARLGWAHGDQEIFTREQMVELFRLDRVSRSPAIFNMEKLNWLNQHYLKSSDPSIIAKSFEEQFKRLNVSYLNGPPLEEVIAIQAERTKTLSEMALRSRYFYSDDLEYDEKAVAKNLTADIKNALVDVRHHLQQLTDWQKEKIHQVITDTAEKQGIKLGNLAQPLRVAMTGNTISPPIDVTLLLIGRDRVLQRIDKAVEMISGTL